MHDGKAESRGSMVWRSGGRRRRRLALVALGEETERVDLPDEVGHAGPAAEPKAHNQDPSHHEGVDHVHGRPAW